MTIDPVWWDMPFGAFGAGVRATIDPLWRVEAEAPRLAESMRQEIAQHIEDAVWQHIEDAIWDDDSDLEIYGDIDDECAAKAAEIDLGAFAPAGQLLAHLRYQDACERRLARQKAKAA